MVKLDNDFHITKQGVIKKNPAKRISKKDVVEALKDGQKAADDGFRLMVGSGNLHVVTDDIDSSKQYGMLGLCGFSWIYFEDVKIKNDLVKAGMTVHKNQYGGFRTRFKLECPTWAMELYPDAYAYYTQSMDLQASGYNGFLYSMQSKGLMMDAYVDSRLD